MGADDHLNDKNPQCMSHEIYTPLFFLNQCRGARTGADISDLDKHFTQLH